MGVSIVYMAAALMHLFNQPKPQGILMNKDAQHEKSN